jgi:hypothetical protein
LETLVFIVVFALVVLLGLVVYGTIAKNNWGINLGRVTCPSCGSEMAHVRVPGSMSEALWGGGTCVKCGCRSDKWGRRITD